MAEETKTHFTFSFFDASHTEGYVASTYGSKKEFKHSSGKQLTSHEQSNGFFSDEEEDEDIVMKIHYWKQNSTKESKMKAPQRRRELHDLFAEPLEKETESDNIISVASDDIQLNRRPDDYMLGEKGDQILQQMEDLTTNDPPSPAQKPKFRFQHNPFDDSQTTNSKPQRSSLDLDTMVSMEDIEKYISEN